MKSLNIFNRNKNKFTQLYRNYRAGITLIEIILVIGIMSITASLGLFVNANSHQGNTFRSSRDLLIATLEHARAQAVNNICLGSECVNGKTHGVHIKTDGNGFITSYILFQGEPYDSADPLNTRIDVSGNTSRNVSLSLGSDVDIYFGQLSGDSNPASITLTNDIETSIITINSEGRITWTN